MTKRRSITMADLFCGAGGTSEGAEHAARQLGLGLDLIGLNHWKRATQTFQRNHPTARVVCEPLDSVDPRKEAPRGVDVLVASPECINHSPAKGGLPLNEQSRASGWHVPRWIDATNPYGVLIENVPAWAKWGPLDRHGRPIKSRRGETFKALLHTIEAQGYRVEYRVLCAADYGDATTRERLFVMARKGKRPIDWPEPSHAARADSLFGRGLQPWRPASAIIDWTKCGRSIYDRPKPLSRKTLARIAEGMRRFWGEPFVLAQAQGGVARAVTSPVPTLTTDGAVRVIEPMVVTLRNHTLPRQVSEPLTAIATSGAHHLLVEAFIASYYGTTNVRRVSEPLPTVTTKDRFALIEPVIIDGQMLDIRARMLQTHELAGAMSLEDYVFEGNQTEQKKQIGNAVPRRLATALCLSHFAAFAGRQRDGAAA